MAKKNEIQIIINAKDNASKVLSGVGSSLGRMGEIAGGILTAGVITKITEGILGLASGVVQLTKEAADVERTRKTFTNLTEDLGNYDDLMGDLRKSTSGMVNDSDLMYASNKLLGMGIAETNEELNKHVENALLLGKAYGMEAGPALEKYTLMMANQSNLVLDSFGISSGIVTQRVEEMTAANKNLTREQAWSIVVMEEMDKAVEKVGDQTVGAAADMDRMKANVDNLKDQIGEKFLPVLAVVSEKLVEAWNDPKIQAGIENVLNWLEKVIGDENSGVVGVITRLFEGDIAGAFDLAFGAGTWEKIETFMENFGTALETLGTIASGVITVLQTLINLFDQSEARARINKDLLSGTPAPMKYRAAGGPVMANGTYLVGERGPEIFTPRVSGNIIPNHRIGAGGQALALTVNINSAINLADRNYAERELMPYIEAGVRQLMARGAA